MSVVLFILLVVIILTFYGVFKFFCFFLNENLFMQFGFWEFYSGSK